MFFDPSELLSRIPNKKLYIAHSCVALDMRNKEKYILNAWICFDDKSEIIEYKEDVGLNIIDVKQLSDQLAILLKDRQCTTKSLLTAL